MIGGILARSPFLDMSYIARLWHPSPPDIQMDLMPHRKDRGREGTARCTATDVRAPAGGVRGYRVC